MSKNVAVTKTFYNSQTKIWHGLQTESEYGSECSIGQAALESLLKNPKHIGQICYHNGREYTNGEIATLAIRVALHFEQLGIEQCEVISLCTTNSDFVAPLFLGAMLAGLTVSALDPSFSKDDMKHIFSMTKPKMVFCDGNVYNTIQLLNAEQKNEFIVYTMKEHIKNVPEITEFLQSHAGEASYQPKSLKFGSSQTAAILCSSGTTGLPKGICMSHIALLNFRLFRQMQNERLLCFSTLYWVSGIFCLIAATLDGGTRIISDRRFSPADLLHITAKYKVTIIMSTPLQLSTILSRNDIEKFDLTSLTTYVSGGSTLAFAMVENIQKYMPNASFVNAYGLSEVAGAVVLGPALANESIGQLVQNVCLKVVDNHGNLLGPKDIGEICIRTPYPWVGYYGNAKLTASVYENDEWIHTRDVGYVDEYGNIFVMDRQKDINLPFSPTKIENVIYKISDVIEVCVCAIDNAFSRQLPAAAIVIRPDSLLREDEVYQFVWDSLAIKLSGGVYFLNDLPTTASGKIQRYKVASICEDLRNFKTPNDVNFKDEY